jgi:hypothetical protein
MGVWQRWFGWWMDSIRVNDTFTRLRFVLFGFRSVLVLGNVSGGWTLRDEVFC